MNHPSDKSLKPSTYHDMHLLNEVTQTPDATQREFSRRIGVALGLTNLMLRRLVKKGYIKISGTKRSRLRYLITPQGILEKSRLTYEFVQYSLHLYSHIRGSLREQLTILAHTSHRKIVLCGTDELAEIAFLTIQEMGLELVGVVDESPTRGRFLGYPVQSLNAASTVDYDRIIVTSLRNDRHADYFTALGIPADRVINFSQLGMPKPIPEGRDSIEAVSPAGSDPHPDPSTEPLKAM